jgi:hypothetical protein
MNIRTDEVRGARHGEAVLSRTIEILSDNREAIVGEAAAKVDRAHLPHYAADGSVRQRLEALFDLLLDSLSTRDLRPVATYAADIAGARFQAWFDLSEVQTAFNVLEEVAWRRLIEDLPPDAVAPGLTIVGTVLGTGKDALARAYVTSAARGGAVRLDVGSLFEGTEGL